MSTDGPAPCVRFRAAKNGAAEIILYGDIGFDVRAADFARELRALGRPEQIDLRINSYGGDVFDGVAIHSLLEASGSRVVVHVDGMAASAASVVAMAGDEVRIVEAGFLMIHDAWMIAAGNAVAMRQAAERLEAVSAQMAGIYQRRTGKELAQIREWMAEEREFSAADAVAAGFATSVVEGRRMAARYDPARHLFRAPPSAASSERRHAAVRIINEMKALRSR
jgi:ATP-dependent protease ClpP protease subunit